MNILEKRINGEKFEARAIESVVIDAKTGESHSLTINGRTLSEVGSKLPEGYDLDKIATLQNYFDTNTVNEFQIELDNSQYIYFEDFNVIYCAGFKAYVKALKDDDMIKINRLDSQVRLSKR